MKNKIYTITTMDLDDPNKSKFIPFSIRVKRCVGWFPTLKEAIGIVEGNYGSLDECNYYTLAVIEEVDDGLYGHTNPDKNVWFEWKDDCWQKIERPECFKQVVAFGMG